MLMKVYLDTCVWGRPFDDQSVERICRETEAFFEIAWRVDAGKIEMVASDALHAEIEDIGDKSKREKVQALITKAAKSSVPLDSKVLKMAKSMVKKCGLGGKDSLQVSSAKVGGAKYFVTVDEDLIAKAECLRRASDIILIDPVRFVRQYE